MQIGLRFFVRPGLIVLVIARPDLIQFGADEE
jgi:hypothetical protein